jgi:hypothetical protein
MNKQTILGDQLNSLLEMKPNLLTNCFFYAFIMTLACTNNAFAQEYIDLLRSDYSISPNNYFEDSLVNTNLQEINVDVTLPVKINEQLALLTGVTCENISASFDHGKRTSSVTGLTLKLGANIKHNDKWSGTYMLLPKIASDFKRISSRDLQVGAAILMKYTKSKYFNYKFGLYANSELFGAFVVPMFGFYYLSSSEKFEAKVLLPLSVDLNYSIANNLKIGFNFKGQVRTYNLNNDLITQDNQYLARSVNDICAYLQYAMKSGVNIQFGIGHSVGRSYRVYDESVKMGIPLVYFGDDRKQLNTDFTDGWLFKVAVIYRLNLGNDN